MIKSFISLTKLQKREGFSTDALHFASIVYLIKNFHLLIKITEMRGS